MAISLMTVIATSSVVSAGTAGRQLINLRLGMLLEIASSIGGLLAGITVQRLTSRTLGLWFAIVTATIAVIMMSRRERRNVLDASVDPGTLGGRFYDEETQREVSYRVKRMPLAMLASLTAGAVSGSLGIGGGILKVPVLNAWCGVPMRAAAATSALMIGVTAVSSVPLQYRARLHRPPARGGGRARRPGRIPRRLLVRRTGAREVAQSADGLRARRGLDALFREVVPMKLYFDFQ